MSDVINTIPFKNTMTLDKRHPEACYLRKNVFASATPGLYPAGNFRTSVNTPLSSGAQVKAYLYGFACIQDGADLKLYAVDLPTGGYILRHTFTGESFKSAVLGNDDARVVTSQSVYKVTYAAAAVTDADPTNAMGLISGGLSLFDGLYYYYIDDTKVWRQLDTATPTQVFNDLGDTPKTFDAYGDKIAFFFEEGLQVTMTLWDKADADFFDKRVIVKNTRFIAGGTVDGALLLFHGIGNSTNKNERDGELVVSIFDGEKFGRANSIKAGNAQVSRLDFSIGSEVIFAAVTGNTDSHNELLYQNYIYKIKHTDEDLWSIEVVFNPPTGETITAVDVQYEYITVGTRIDSAKPELYNNIASGGAWSALAFDETRHITNFLNQIENRHKLDFIAVAAEKLTGDKNEESLTLQYRVSDREDFVTLATITAENVKDYVDTRIAESVRQDEYDDDNKFLTHQVFIVSKMPDGSPLPEFNEMQFDFQILNGFSVAKAWYGYSYITRNMR